MYKNTECNKTDEERWKKFLIAMLVMAVSCAGLVAFQSHSLCGADAFDESFEASVVSDGAEVRYSTLEEAFANALDGDEVILQKSVDNKGTIIVTGGRTIIFDLNGNDVEFNDVNGFKIENAVLQINGTGTVSIADDKCSYASSAVRMSGSTVAGTSDYSVLNVSSGVTLTAGIGVQVSWVNLDGKKNNEQHGIVVNLYGKVVSEVKTGDYPGTGINIYGNLCNQTETAPKLNLYPGSSVVNKSGGVGIYAAGYAQFTASGSYIEGITAIEIRAGILNLSDTTIVATGESTVVAANPSGSTTEGVGVALSQHNTKQPLRVLIESGSISGNTAVDVVNPQNNGPDALAKVSLEINGGSIATNNGGTDSVASIEGVNVSIRGGTFSSDVEDLLAKGARMAKSGSLWYVGDDAGTSATKEVIGGAAVIDNTGSDRASFIAVKSQDATITAALRDLTLVMKVKDLAQGAYEITAGKADRPDIGQNVICIETPNVTASSIAVSIPLDASSIQQVDSVKAYHYDNETGQKEYISDATAARGVLSFTVGGEGCYGYEYTTSYIDFDDDDRPIEPVAPSTASTGSGDETAVLACAAAAVVMALMVAFLVFDPRRP